MEERRKSKETSKRKLVTKIGYKKEAIRGKEGERKNGYKKSERKTEE